MEQLAFSTRCRNRFSFIGHRYRTTQTRERRDDIVAIDLGTHHGVETRNAEIEHDRLGLLFPHIHDARAHGATRYRRDKRS